jgi:hypothetical protein
MSHGEEREPVSTAAHRFLSRLREWWQRGSELDAIDPDTLEQIAGDLGMTGRELKDLAARGPDAAHLLYERMRVLGLTRADVERVAPGLMRELELNCSGCREKGVCERDLATRPDDPDWEGYCPNAATLSGVKIFKGHSPS